MHAHLTEKDTDNKNSGKLLNMQSFRCRLLRLTTITLLQHRLHPPSDATE